MPKFVVIRVSFEVDEVVRRATALAAGTFPRLSHMGYRSEHHGERTFWSFVPIAEGKVTLLEDVRKAEEHVASLEDSVVFLHPDNLESFRELCSEGRADITHVFSVGDTALVSD